MCCTRDARPEEAEEDWPENPWQAQANAHLLQLHGGASCNLQGVPIALGVPALLCCGLAVAGPAPHSSLASDVGMPSDMAATSMGSGPAAAAAAAAAAAQRVADLEGQIAVLEETLVCKQRDLDDATRVPVGNSGTCPHLHSSCQSSVEVSEEMHELRRRNEFMQLLVARYERKTMGLEEELASLTLSRCEAESRAEAATAAAKHQAELAVEFEEHAASLEERFIACEAELLQLREGLGSRASVAEPLSAENPVPVTDENAQALGFRDRCAFLEGLVARFEHKTMALESQLRDLSPLRRQAHEETSKQRAAIWAKEVELQDWKRKHDRQQQESSRQRKALEKQKVCLEAETKRLQDLCRQPEEPLEVKRLKDLNTQLMERLATERGNSAQTKQALEAALQNIEDLEHRAARLSEQLCELAEVNDDLEEKLVASNLKQTM